MVLRRGYGKSDGEWAEGFGECTRPDYLAAAHGAVADLRAAVDLSLDAAGGRRAQDREHRRGLGRGLRDGRPRRRSAAQASSPR